MTGAIAEIHAAPEDGQVITVRCVTAKIAEDMAASYRKAGIDAWTEADGGSIVDAPETARQRDLLLYIVDRLVSSYDAGHDRQADVGR